MSNKIKRTNTGGFTFIELIVATGILLSLVGFGTASYVNFNERQILEQTAKDLKNTLRIAQQNAITGVKDSSLCTPITGPNANQEQTFRGWCMSPVNTDVSNDAPQLNYEKYQIYGVCDTDENDTESPLTFSTGNTFDIPDVIKLKVGVSNGTTYVYATDNTGDPKNRVRFNVFGNNSQLAESTDVKVTYCLEGTFPSLGTDNKYAITVRNSGEIIDEGFTNDCFQDAT